MCSVVNHTFIWPEGGTCGWHVQGVCCHVKCHNQHRFRRMGKCWLLANWAIYSCLLVMCWQVTREHTELVNIFYPWYLYPSVYEWYHQAVAGLLGRALIHVVVIRVVPGVLVGRNVGNDPIRTSLCHYQVPAWVTGYYAYTHALENLGTSSLVLSPENYYFYNFKHNWNDFTYFNC